MEKALDAGQPSSQKRSSSCWELYLSDCIGLFRDSSEQGFIPKVKPKDTQQEQSFLLFLILTISKRKNPV